MKFTLDLKTCAFSHRLTYIELLICWSIRVPTVGLQGGFVPEQEIKSEEKSVGACHNNNGFENSAVSFSPPT